MQWVESNRCGKVPYLSIAVRVLVPYEYSYCTFEGNIIPGGKAQKLPRRRPLSLARVSQLEANHAIRVTYTPRRLRLLEGETEEKEESGFERGRGGEEKEGNRRGASKILSWSFTVKDAHQRVLGGPNFRVGSRRRFSVDSAAGRHNAYAHTGDTRDSREPRRDRCANDVSARRCRFRTPSSLPGTGPANGGLKPYEHRETPGSRNMTEIMAGAVVMFPSLLRYYLCSLAGVPAVCCSRLWCLRLSSSKSGSSGTEGE
jgi:hypothetical protein